MADETTVDAAPAIPEWWRSYLTGRGLRIARHVVRGLADQSRERS